MDINVVKALIFHKVGDTFKLLILTRSAHVKKFPGFDDLPGGKVDANEDLMDALAREIKEETQLAVDHIEHITTHRWSDLENPDIQYQEYVFGVYAEDATVKLSPEEHNSFRWISLDQIEKTSLHPGMKKIILNQKDKIIEYTKNFGKFTK